MRWAKKTLLILSFVVLASSILYAADLDFPYGRFRMKYAPSEDPFPGLGNYYSALSKGMKSALWNPASIGKLKLSETSISMISPMEIYNYERSFTVNERSGDIEFDENASTPGGKYGIFLRYPRDIDTGISTREIDIMSHANYASQSTGMNFTSALKVNDWITIGFASNNPFEIDMNIAGDIPVTARATTDFYGQEIGSLEVDANGHLSYIDENGITYTSPGAVWSDFISQEATIPLIAFSEFRNNVNIQSPYTGTIASKIGNFYLGLNMIPIYATANIDNDVRPVVSAGTADILLYTPDFDPDDPADIQDWVNDPDQYSQEGGFSKKTLRLPTGEVVGTAKYRGFYAASTVRFDIGAMYDISDWLTVGVVLENLGGSSLNFKGNGIATFMNYRELNTAEAGEFEDLFQPGESRSIDLVSGRWITTFEVQDTKLYLEPEKTYELPKRIRYGFAFKKPFLIAVDFEQNQTPITIRATQDDEMKEYTISNINLLRLGVETQLLMFPVWMRGGITFMLKPNVTGLDADSQEKFDNAFQYGVFPLKLDLGSDSNFWGTTIGNSFGINGQALLSFMQFDSTNIDLGKLVYYNMYVARDAWQISYLALVDPLATAASYGTKTVPDGEKKQFEVSDVKFIQTLGVTYRF